MCCFTELKQKFEELHAKFHEVKELVDSLPEHEDEDKPKDEDECLEDTK